MGSPKTPVYVYIAGPYTQPDPAVNVRAAIDAAEAVVKAGGTPFVPHLSHFWHFVHPGDYEQWMRLDFDWLAKCDLMVRLHGESPGADREADRAEELGIPVVTLDDAIDIVRDICD